MGTMISTFYNSENDGYRGGFETTPIPFPRAPAHLVDRSSPGSTMAFLPRRLLFCWPAPWWAAEPV